MVKESGMKEIPMNANIGDIVRGKTWTHLPMPDMSRRITRHGERHVAAKLTRSDVAEIRRRVGDGESQSRVARAFGVTQANVSSIVCGKTWRDAA